jgi:hypothetical protein
MLYASQILVVELTGFLDRNGELDPFASPGERATDARLAAFVAGLRDRVAPRALA